MATPTITGVISELPVSARLVSVAVPPTVAGLGSLRVWVVVPVSLPRVRQSSMPVKRFSKPPGPLIVKS